MTVASLIAADCIAPPQAIAADVTTPYHFRCDEPRMVRQIVHFGGRTPAGLSDQSAPDLAEMIDGGNLRELNGQRFACALATLSIVIASTGETLCNIMRMGKQFS